MLLIVGPHPEEEKPAGPFLNLEGDIYGNLSLDLGLALGLSIGLVPSKNIGLVLEVAKNEHFNKIIKLNC